GPTTAGQYLRSSGANTWSVGTIQLGDLPNLTNSFWSLTGNTGTLSTTNFLGTTDGQPLVVKTNNAERLRIDPNGNVSIGTGPAPQGGARLLVDGAGVSVGVYGRNSGPFTGVAGIGDTGIGVTGISNDGIGVYGQSESGVAMQAYSRIGTGM